MASNAPISEVALMKAQQDTAGELMQARSTALAQSEIQGAIILAKRFPRNEDASFQSMLRACRRTGFADAAEYEFPRGKDNEGKSRFVSGPSAKFAREFARCWQNVRYGTIVTRDDKEERTITSYAWDVENNLYKESSATFKKLVQRKVRGTTEWIAPDERDLRELNNKYGAIGERNCLLSIIPQDMIEDCIRQARETLESEAKQDPDQSRKRILAAFDLINVTVPMIEEYLGHNLQQCSPAELAELRRIWKSIEEGNSTWTEYVKPKASTQVATATARKASDLDAKYSSSPTTTTDQEAPKPTSSTPSGRGRNRHEDSEKMSAGSRDPYAGGYMV
jgi:hypothetical protein